MASGSKSVRREIRRSRRGLRSGAQGLGQRMRKRKRMRVPRASRLGQLCREQGTRRPAIERIQLLHSAFRRLTAMRAFRLRAD